MKKAMMIVLSISLLASLLFLINHGFGGGHGSLDRALGILGLPWSLFRWPHFLYTDDFIWLVVLPFGLNALSVLLFIGIHRCVRDNTQ